MGRIIISEFNGSCVEFKGKFKVLVMFFVIKILLKRNMFVKECYFEILYFWDFSIYIFYGDKFLIDYYIFCNIFKEFYYLLIIFFKVKYDLYIVGKGNKSFS